jgi:hypothetical protein
MTPPTKEAVEKLLDVSLQPEGVPPSSTDLVGTPRSGPFSEVEFRQPGRDKAYGLWIFSFTVHKGLRLQREEFSSDLIGPSYGLNVHDWTWRHSVERNGGSIHFAFSSRPSALVEIAVHRNVVPPDFE